ncbi:hypothetical protein [Poseidonocella sp. HB161398]|uniref:hypothetical protein n=1 Tax=Poseidonocella sp. HB161398 TaxID=2320855 RepID=UPI0011097E8E|nr:hypothetical protein [Poseidonocella sp. HB161398]
MSADMDPFAFAGALEEGKALIEGRRGDRIVSVIALNMAPRLARYRRQMEQELRERATDGPLLS